MHRKYLPIVISLGGSVVVPPTGIDTTFLKAFREVVLREVKKGRRFILIVGGGSTGRHYIRAAQKVARLTHEDLDWLGIHSTRLNGHLLRTVFRVTAHPKMLKNPTRRTPWSEKVLVAAGWKPGWSTDYVAVRFAHLYGADTVINLSNISQVYDRDPKKYPNARPQKEITWTAFRKIVGSKWSPGLNAPFDPVASALAHKWKMRVIVAKGTEIKNFQNILDSRPFIGTTIR